MWDQVFLLCLLAGCSISWFNTVCFVLCIRNFPVNKPLALSLTVSFNGVSAALYTLAANSVNPSSDSVYLLLNALIPLLTSIAALVPILRQPALHPLPPDRVHRDSFIFLILNVLAIVTGLYLLIFSSSTSDESTARCFFGFAIFLLVFPLCIPGVIYAREWFHQTIHSRFYMEGSHFILVHEDDLELHKELLSRQNSTISNVDSLRLLSDNNDGSIIYRSQKGKDSDDPCCCEHFIEKDQLIMLGEEHPASVLVRRLDFWLYYVTYFCGGTIGLVYSNNLGQIAQSLGLSSSTSTLVTLYSAFSFFGRLLSAGPDYIRKYVFMFSTL